MFWPKQFPGCVSLWLLLLCLLQRKYSQSISNVFQSTRLCLPKTGLTTNYQKTTATTWSGPKPTQDSWVCSGLARPDPGETGPPKRVFSLKLYCRSLCQGRPSIDESLAHSQLALRFVRSQLNSSSIVRPSYYTILFIVRLFSIIRRVEWQRKVYS